MNINSIKLAYWWLNKTRVGWDGLMSLMPMGNEWLQHRRLAQKFFRQNVIAQYYPIQLRKVRRMLHGLLDTPERFNDHNKMCVYLRSRWLLTGLIACIIIARLSMSVPMSILYGHNLESLNDPLIVASEKSNTIILKLLQPGYTLINTLPFLQHIPSWIPGAITQRMAKESKKMTEMLKLNPLETVKKQMVSTFISGLRKKWHGNINLGRGNSSTVLGFQIYQRRLREPGGPKDDRGFGFHGL